MATQDNSLPNPNATSASNPSAQLTAEEVQQIRAVMGELSAIAKAFRSGNLIPPPALRISVPQVPPPMTQQAQSPSPTQRATPFVHMYPAPPLWENQGIYQYQEEVRARHDDVLELRLKNIEIPLKAAQESEGVRGTTREDLCSPPKFKIPNFEKYDGTGDPYAHLRQYIATMGPYAQDPYLRLHIFQHSLTGVALRWFLDQDVLTFRTWEDLVNSFLRQFSYNMGLLHNRFSLDKVHKKPNESFREYATRWLAIAPQVKPPLDEKEMVANFIQAQEGAYHDKIRTMAGRSFADIVLQGEVVEYGLRSEKIMDTSVIKVASEVVQAGSSAKTFSDENEEVPRFHRYCHTIRFNSCESNLSSRARRIRLSEFSY